MTVLTYTLHPAIVVLPQEGERKPTAWVFQKTIPRHTTQWSLEPDPQNSGLTRLTTDAYIASRDDEVIYAAVKNYMEECLKKNAIIDLSDDNHRMIACSYRWSAPQEPHPVHKASPADKRLG